jgi:tRNA-splicing ligase RtcB
MEKLSLHKIAECLWEIPQSSREGMRVPAYVYAMEEMLESLGRDRSLEQLTNVATLPGIVKAAMAMPDVHEGYGFPIGGVAATRWPDGAISPGGIGYDINCGVRLLLSDVTKQEIKNRLEDVAKDLFDLIPTGAGKSGDIKLEPEVLDKVLQQGVMWAVENNYGERDDIQYIESKGQFPDADPAKVSEEAKKRGHDQLGTIGSGNHFVEIDEVNEIYRDDIANAYGLRKNQIVILIHTGSRGLGHQVATDYIRLMMQAMPKYGITVPDRELACVPFNSNEGQDYYHAMAAAANFAWCNREIVTWRIRKAWNKLLGISGGSLRLLYDVAHNIAKIEEYDVDGQKLKLIVHRKGATRAFGPGNIEVPKQYSSVGQPVLIPGSMGTSSFVLAGTNKSMEATFGSACHGAGRQMSRTAVRKIVEINELERRLEEQEIFVRGSRRGLSEEAPEAYKNIDLVVETVQRAGIANKVARLKPLVVIKG